MSDYFDIPENPDRRAFIASELARLRLDKPAPGPGPDQKLALAKHDHLFGVFWGCTLGAKPPEVTTGDPVSRDD